METKSVIMLCNQRVAEELIAQDENFKHVVVICPWMKLWGALISSGDIYLKEEIAGVKKE